MEAKQFMLIRVFTGLYVIAVTFCNNSPAIPSLITLFHCIARMHDIDMEIKRKPLHCNKK